MAVGDMDACSHHEKNRVVLFCQTCEELICTKCISKSPSGSARHQDHVYLDLMDAYDIQMEDTEKLVLRLKESVEMKKKQRREALSRIQKLKFELLRKKGYVSKRCRSLRDLLKTEKHHFNSKLELVISPALQKEEHAHSELDFDTVAREGLIGAVDSMSKVSPLRCIFFLKNMTRIKREIKQGFEKDRNMGVLGSGDDWVNRINALRDITLCLDGEKKSLTRALMFPTKVPSPPHILRSWCVVGSDSANIVWKFRRQEPVYRFRIVCSPADPQKSRLLVPSRTIVVRPRVVKRNHVVLRNLEEDCTFHLQIYAGNSVGESGPAEVCFHTHPCAAEPGRQGRVWATSSVSSGTKNKYRIITPTLCGMVRTVSSLLLGSLLLLALLWLIFATFQRELCGVLRGGKSNDDLTDVCPLRIDMAGQRTADFGDDQNRETGWLHWLYR